MLKRDLVKVFHSYNVCVGDSKFLEAKAKTQFEWGVGAGVSLTQLKFKGPNIKFPNSVDPTFLLSLNTIFPRNMNVWSVYSEIQYKSYQTQKSGYLIDMGYLRLNLAYRYTSIMSQIKPFGQFGFTIGHAIASESNRDFNKRDQGAFVSVGATQNKLGVEIRFEYTTGMAPSLPITSSVISNYLLVSYKIN
ncbi:MAG: outer membrane beta-barrel protein [Cyclobacteriaceae bacterium]